MTESKIVNEEKTDAQKETRDPNRRIKVVAGLSSNCPTLTPIYKINLYTDVIQSEVFEHLGQYEEYGSTNFVGVLMKEWKQTAPDTYDIELYDYIKDSAGNPLKASDVKYSFDREKEGGVASAKYIKEVTVTGDYTFTLQLTSGSVGLFEETIQNLWVFTQAAMEASSDEMATDPVGTGPYVCTDYVAGSYAEMEKRDDYWQKDELRAKCAQANVDVIRTEFITETTQMSIAVETGAVQIGFWLGESIAPDLLDLPGRTSERFNSLASRVTVFNCSENSIFGGENGKLLRQAFCYAMDENMLVELALNGIGQPTTTFGNKGYIGWNDEWLKQDYYSYNPEKAKELMTQAGYPDGFTCSFWGTEDNLTKTYLQTAQTLLEAANIHVELNFVTSAVNTQNQNDLAAGWDVYNISYTPGNNYQASLFNFYCNNTLRKHGRTVFGVLDDDLQALVEKATSTEWTQADLDKLHDEIVENAWVYKHYETQYVASYVNEIEGMYLNWRQDVNLGAFTYGDDYCYYAD